MTVDGSLLRAVIFDLDGTLLDSVGLFYELALDLASSLDFPAPTREALYTAMALGEATVEKLVPADFPDRKERLRALAVEGQERWMRRYFEESKPIPGTIEVIQLLHRRGLSLGIATSSWGGAPFLDRWGVRDLFGAVVGREDVEQRKPAPEPLLLCVSRLGCKAEQAVYVGDSAIDVRAGKAAGMRTVGVLSGTSSRALLEAERPDAIVEKVADLWKAVGDWVG